jgi:hypothetical protein
MRPGWTKQSEDLFPPPLVYRMQAPAACHAKAPSLHVNLGYDVPWLGLGLVKAVESSVGLPNS